MAKANAPVPESRKLIALKIAGGCCSAMCIALFLLAVGCSMLIKDKPTYTVALSDVTWKTFTSEDLDFTFQFPNDWSVWQPGVDDKVAANATEAYVSTGGSIWSFDIAGRSGHGFMDIRWTNHATVDAIVTEYHYRNTKPVVVDGVTGITFTDTAHGDLYTMDYVGYVFPVKGRTLKIQFNGDKK